MRWSSKVQNLVHLLHKLGSDATRMECSCFPLTKKYTSNNLTNTCPKTSNFTPFAVRNSLVSATSCVSPRAIRTAKLSVFSASRILLFCVFSLSAKASTTAFWPRKRVFQLWPLPLKLFVFESLSFLYEEAAPDKKTRIKTDYFAKFSWNSRQNSDL